MSLVMAKRFIIGGEFTLGPDISRQPLRQSVQQLAEQYHPGYKFYLTGGGYYSLKAILQHLKSKKLTDYPVLLPSFLCPTVLIPFRELNVPYQFYRVDSRLRSDFEHIASLLTNPAQQAMVIIPYFGFGFHEDTRKGFEELRKAGLTIIEDRAQCLFPGFEPIGDYLFYSFRKFLPTDGSMLLAKEEMTIQPDHDNQDYKTLRRKARQLRHRFTVTGEGAEAEFLDLLKQAEQNYYKPGIAKFDKENLDILLKTDITNEITKRKEHYNLLHKQLSEIALLKEPLPDNSSPLCYPVVIENRDKVRAFLKEQKVFAPVHWIIREEDVPSSFSDAHLLASTILSLPIRLDLPEEAYCYMIRLMSQVKGKGQK